MFTMLNLNPIKAQKKKKKACEALKVQPPGSRDDKAFPSITKSFSS